MPILQVTKQFTFDAAHFLTKYHGKCERLHGHTYKLEITLEGPVQENGMVLDFALLKRVVKTQVLDKFDHHCINDVLENPSAENMAVWIWNQLADLQTLLQSEIADKNLPESLKTFVESTENMNVEGNEFVKLKRIQLWETPTSCVVYEGK